LNENNNDSSPKVRESKPRAKLYQRYSFSRVFIYEFSTFLHYLVGGLGLIIGYTFLRLGYLIGLIYIIFAFLQMYILMPLTVCPNCVYYRMEDSRCVSGLNKISRKLAKEGNPENFPKRAEGLFCYNNIYMAALFFPIVASVPALILNFSYYLLITFLIVLGLLIFRFFVIFPKVACLHCQAKYTCPIGEKIGVRDK
jgi:fatty acid desaturase